jgi:hypothetical protein
VGVPVRNPHWESPIGGSSLAVADWQSPVGDCLREGDPNDSASAWAFTDAIQGVGGSFTPSRNLRGSYKYRLLDSIRHPADRTHQATAPATASATAQVAT